MRNNAPKTIMVKTTDFLHLTPYVITTTRIARKKALLFQGRDEHMILIENRPVFYPLLIVTPALQVRPIHRVTLHPTHHEI
jgi:hypothetical protein